MPPPPILVLAFRFKLLMRAISPLSAGSSLGWDASLEGLHGDGEAEGHEEDSVDESAQHLGPSPTKGVLAPGLGRHSHYPHNISHFVVRVK